jgi:hypothetical protein
MTQDILYRDLGKQTCIRLMLFFYQNGKQMVSTLRKARVSRWLFTALITFTAVNSFAEGGLVQVSKEPVVVYGFLKKSGTNAAAPTRGISSPTLLNFNKLVRPTAEK